MVQGTTSDAGKSVLVAGLCRWLARKNISVAPLKPQNMSLNSAVTVDGGEIGRAQAVQAQACYLAAHTDMNPVLLKPSSDTGAQVIIHGKALHSMEASVYQNYKAIALDAVLTSHQRLLTQYQTIIVEGAGSPAEINLRENDIANMGFAEAVDCPVIIVADIDRGGVFSHLVGTLALLSSNEQNRVIGFVINRFRGDISLLQSGLDWLEQRTGKPVLGVLPYLNNFYLDAEDAIASNAIASKMSSNHNPSLKIAVPVFSRISNHTDFDALALHPDVQLDWVGPGGQFPPADLIILPGSKNVRKDLQLLKEYGWDQAIMRHLRFGGKLLGVCAGYQMLGEKILDPEGIEDQPGESEGLGLLKMTTELSPEKVLKVFRGHLELHSDFSESQVDDSSYSAEYSIAEGYEIHCGVSSFSLQYPALWKDENGNPEGVIAHDISVIGTYVHGLFDQPQVAQQILAWAGLKTDQAIDVNELREKQLNRLADCIDEYLDNDFLQQLAQGTLK